MFAPFRSPLICTITVTLALLTGCGQKGPLFMPVKQPVTPAPAPAPLQPSMPVPATPAAPANGAAAATSTSAATPSPR
ncbi:MAG: lipoprotein [Herminiimonas sp.]|nr:lipoprotein [Herminiimonas sp.]